MTPSAAPGMGAREALRVLLRALTYVAPVRGRMGVKAVLTAVSLVPILLAPWPAKLLIDQVVLDRPLESGGYPPVLMPVVERAAALDPFTLLLVLSAALLVGILLFGVFGTSGSQRDITEGNVASGLDTATRTENAANLGFSLAGGLFGILDFRYTIRLTQTLNHHYRSRLYERIQTLPMPALGDARVGDAIYRIMYDTPAITGLVYEVLLTPFVVVCQIGLVSWILLVTYPENGWLAVSALLIGPLIWAVGLPFTAWIRRSGERSREAGSTSTSTLEEGLSNVLVVQSLGGEAHQRRRFDRDSDSTFGEFRGIVRAIAAAALAISAIVGVLLVWMTQRVTDLVIVGALTPGDFLVLFGYFSRIALYAGRLGSVWISVQYNLAGLRRVFWLMDLEPERDVQHARPLTRVARGVELRGVHYRYTDGAHALAGVDLHVPLGRITALVGPAGAGKTTLAALIPRFLDASAGSVRIDGVDVRDFTLASLRSQISFVFQESALLDATVEENLRLGHPEALDADVRRAAVLAGADGFIRELPEGYATPLGRGGGKLSIGQRQRLAIARALVRPARILILDEPTSALDPATERALVESLREISRERAVLVIAHRLATIRDADEIVFLDAGRVLERGTHDELMRRPGGAYRRFTSLQTQGAA